MSLYASLFGAKEKSGGPDHFQVRPFAQHDLDEDAGVGRAHERRVPCSSKTAPPVDTHASLSGAIGNALTADNDAGRQVQRVVHASQQVVQSDDWQTRYDKSVENIQDHIQAIAGAVAMLDAVEHKLIAIKSELQRIRSADLRIDGDKVLVALQALSDYVNQAVTSVDDQCVNLLRDAKLEIRFAETAHQSAQPDGGVALTMISIDALLNYKIKKAFEEGLVADETPEFVDDISRIVSSNIQILTAILLSLFASRDYTQAVVKFAERENILPKVGHASRAQIESATIDRLQFDRVDSGNLDEELQAGRASLSELLKKVQDERGHISSAGI